jgi:hypothetical protein
VANPMPTLASLSKQFTCQLRHRVIPYCKRELGLEGRLSSLKLARGIIRVARSPGSVALPQADWACIAKSGVGASAARTQARAPSERRERCPQVSAFNGMAERFGDPPGHVREIGLDLAAAQPVVDQPQKPSRQVCIQPGPCFDLKQGNDILMELEDSLRVTDRLRRVKLGQVLASCLGPSRLKLILQCGKPRIIPIIATEDRQVCFG